MIIPIWTPKCKHLLFSKDIATPGEFQLIFAAFIQDFSLLFGTPNARRFTNSCAEERIGKQR